MDRADWTVVAHAGIDLMNPLTPAKLDEVIEVLALPAGARVLDLGCGKGELLKRLAARYEIRGIGVDRSPALLDEARRRAPGGVTYVVADLSAFATGAPFDLAASLGASVGGYRATLERLARHLHPGGLALLGEGYWRADPSRAYLAALEAKRDEMPDYPGLFAAAAEHGLEPRYAVTASVDDFDRYEWRWSLNGERYAAAHAGEPGVDDFLAWIRNGRRRYVELGGRHTLGFGLFLFERAG
jgi:SAM-dependent methyltransferase